MPNPNNPTNWHEDAFFGLHYDLHAGADDKVLGRDLTVEHLVERLSRVRPDWIQCDCKGHPGYTSWPTEVGSTSPGMVQDALRLHREATRQLGIPLGMHYSGVWDSRAIELHPDWARVDEDGIPDGPNRPAPKEGQKTTISMRSDSTCRLGPYDRELMIPQMLELVEKYDVDGFWVDGENWASKPCYCDRCTAEYTRRSGNSAIPRSAEEEGWDAWLGFHRDLFEEHVTAYADAVHAAKPTCMICSNWMYTMRQPDPIRAHVDYLSGDFDWTWGADRAAVEGRLLDARGLPWDLMAWAFTKTGTMQDPPPWVMKSPLHLSQECSEVVALGGAVMIYNSPQRAGRLTDWHQDTLAEVASFCRARKDLCFKSETVPQVAILHLSQHLYAHNQPLFNNGTAAAAIEGALHALLETQHSVDILPEDAALERMNRYPLVVVPERTRPSAAIQAALLAYAENGGTVLLTGTNLNHDYPDLVAPAKDGPSERDGSGDPAASTIYLPTGRRAVPISGHWQAGHVDATTDVWLEYLSQQEPARDGTGNAAVTARRVGEGRIVAVHGPIFENYFIGHYPRLRDVVRELIAKMGIPWIVEADGPARLEVLLRRKDGKLRINLINRGSGEALSPRRVAIEELPPIEHVTLRVRLDERPAKIGHFPENRPLDWQYSDGVATIRVEQVDIHSVVSIG